MNEPKYTTGPWEAKELSKIEALIVQPCDTSLPPICLVDRQMNAWSNANLIASAPQMYEALIDARRALDFAREKLGSLGMFEIGVGHIEAAIAKAEGKQP